MYIIISNSSAMFILQLIVLTVQYWVVRCWYCRVKLLKIEIFTGIATFVDLTTPFVAIKFNCHLVCYTRNV